MERSHPLRRAEDGQDARIDVVLTHLNYLREGLDDLNTKVGIQNGRVSRTEAQVAEITTRAAIQAANLDRNVKVLSIVVAVVGAAVTGAVKWL